MEEKKQMEVVVEDEDVSEASLLQFIEDSNQVEYYSEYNQFYLVNY